MILCGTCSWFEEVQGCGPCYHIAHIQWMQGTRLPLFRRGTGLLRWLARGGGGDEDRSGAGKTGTGFPCVVMFVLQVKMVGKGWVEGEV